MKKHFFFLIALALLASCTSDVVNKDLEFISHVTITASDFETENATRTLLELTNSGLSFTWAENDVVGIYPNAGDQVSFPMTSGAGTKRADFDGGGWALKGNYTYSAYYPYNVENTYYGRSYTALPISYLGQRQTENNSTAGLGAYDYMVATASTPESGNVTFNFSHIGSVLYIQLTTPKAATFTQLTLSTNEAIFITEATVNISNATLTPTSTAKEVTLELDNVAIEAGGTLYAWMLIAPMNANGKTLTATATTSDAETQTVDIVGKNYLTGKAYQLIGRLTTEGTSGTGGTGEDIGWGEDDTNMENGYEYVDLGLPSGIKWAKYNLGASSEEEIGNRYAWGETETKESFPESSYKWGEWEMTKYNSIDGLSQLEKEDDVAHIVMRGHWRMPTKEEAEELFSLCSWEQPENGVVPGFRVTGSNNNSIFLPCNGQFDESGLHWEDTEVYLWTSDCNDYYGYSMTNWGVYDQNHRHDGLCIRAVYDENYNTVNYEYVDLGLPSGTLWATVNIGANSPEDYGQYFAWGELEEKTDYSTQAYLYYNGSYENIGTDIAILNMM